jgi:predicted alpha/beta-hydrolase family hydrolase
MGGRMTSLASSEGLLPEVIGLVFFGFPLHPAGKPATKRADHLSLVEAPMLFLQGPRDTLATPELLGPVIRRLGKRATLHSVEGADHGFKVLKRSGRTEEDVILELAETAARWIGRRV